MNNIKLKNILNKETFKVNSIESFEYFVLKVKVK